MTRSLGLDVALLAASLPTCETNSWVFGWYDLQHPKRSDERALRLFTNERYELKRRNAKAGVFFLMQDPLNAVSLDTIMRGVGNPGLWTKNSLLRTHLSLFWSRWACYAAASFFQVWEPKATHHRDGKFIHTCHIGLGLPGPGTGAQRDHLHLPWRFDFGRPLRLVRDESPGQNIYVAFFSPKKGWKFCELHASSEIEGILPTDIQSYWSWVFLGF